MRAVRLDVPLVLDGVLDEAIYERVRPASNFIQVEPRASQPAMDQTDVWVMFDDNNLYVTARCFDSAPSSEWVANEMRHDVIQLRQNDSFSILLDTFHDRRNGVAFLVTPIGGYSDFAITNEGSVNTDWNVVWDMRTGRFEGGWTVEGPTNPHVFRELPRQFTVIRAVGHRLYLRGILRKKGWQPCENEREKTNCRK